MTRHALATALGRAVDAARREGRTLDEMIGVLQIAWHVTDPDRPQPDGSRFERADILAELARQRHVGDAARVLGLSTSGLYAACRRLGIDVREARRGDAGRRSREG